MAFYELKYIRRLFFILFYNAATVESVSSSSMHLSHSHLQFKEDF